MESSKIKAKILKILDTDRNLILTMLNYLPSFSILRNYFESADYLEKYEKLKLIKDTTEKDFEISKLDSKAHWIFKCIEKGDLSNFLFLDKDDDLISDEKIKKILETIIVIVGKYESIRHGEHIQYDDKNKHQEMMMKPFSKLDKNLPKTKKKHYLETIQNMEMMVNELQLDYEIKYYHDEKEYYDVNSDKYSIIDIKEFMNTLKILKKEISNISGNDKKTFIKNKDQLNIKNRFHYPNEIGFKEALLINLSNISECTKKNRTESVNYLIEFLNNR